MQGASAGFSIQHEAGTLLTDFRSMVGGLVVRGFYTATLEEVAHPKAYLPHPSAEALTTLMPLLLAQTTLKHTDSDCSA